MATPSCILLLAVRLPCALVQMDRHPNVRALAGGAVSGVRGATAPLPGHIPGRVARGLRAQKAGYLGRTTGTSREVDMIKRLYVLMTEGLRKPG